MSRTPTQPGLFPNDSPEVETATTTFLDNMKLPVHRWFRYSAGFSAEWAQATIEALGARVVLDPFAGSGTTLLSAERVGVASYGIEAHPFVYRIARAKLSHRTSTHAFSERARQVRKRALSISGDVSAYPPLIRQCFDDDALRSLDSLRRAWVESADDSAASELVWLAIVSILRRVSHAGTAPWQYVLPQKRKKSPVGALAAFDQMTATILTDLTTRSNGPESRPTLMRGDARSCEEIPDGVVDAVVTSPPYPNNYDYADATRLEMCFMGEIKGWGDLHDAVRRHLITSCSQHWSERTLSLEATLSRAELSPIRDNVASVCQQLADVRVDRGGRKNYHLMIAAYFADIARVWQALRRVCRSGSRVCFVIGDSAPYGVYVPVVEWTAALAQAAGFGPFTFEKTRDRNVKWKNRKHRVPLCEGRLRVDG